MTEGLPPAGDRSCSTFRPVPRQAAAHRLSSPRRAPLNPAASPRPTAQARGAASGTSRRGPHSNPESPLPQRAKVQRQARPAPVGQPAGPPPTISRSPRGRPAPSAAGRAEPVSPRGEAGAPRGGCPRVPAGGEATPAGRAPRAPARPLAGAPPLTFRHVGSGAQLSREPPPVPPHRARSSRETEHDRSSPRSGRHPLQAKGRARRFIPRLLPPRAGYGPADDGSGPRLLVSPGASLPALEQGGQRGGSCRCLTAAAEQRDGGKTRRSELEKSVQHRGRDTAVLRFSLPRKLPTCTSFSTSQTQRVPSAIGPVLDKLMEAPTWGFDPMESLQCTAINLYRRYFISCLCCFCFGVNWIGAQWVKRG